MAGDRAAAGDQTPISDRTRALEDEAASMAKRATAEAARNMQAVAERVAHEAQDVGKVRVEGEISGTDIGNDVAQAVDDVTATLGSITDQASAQGAVPKLVELDTRLYVLKFKIAKLSDFGRQTLASRVTGSLPQLQSVLARVQAIAGANEIVKPAVDPIIGKLNRWARDRV